MAAGYKKAVVTGKAGKKAGTKTAEGKQKGMPQAIHFPVQHIYVSGLRTYSTPN